MRQFFLANNHGTILSEEEQKSIFGGLIAPAECSVTCSDGSSKSRDCGRGTSCSTSGTTIYCGTDGQDMCKKTE